MGISIAEINVGEVFSGIGSLALRLDCNSLSAKVRQYDYWRDGCYGLTAILYLLK